MNAGWQALVLANLPQRGPWNDPRLLWMTLALIGILLLGALIFAWLDRWRKRTAAPPPGAKDHLAHFRQLYEQGVLSQEEYDRIRGRLTQQLRQDWQMPAAPERNAPPPGADGPAASRGS
jgi:hypothetical protein